MKAIVQPAYGSPDVLQLQEVDRPDVKDDEVLVRVLGASVNFADWATLTGTPYPVRAAEGLLKPRRSIPGRDMAGRVEAVGPKVTQFQPGAEVFGELSGGAYAEYVAAAEEKVALKPLNLTFEEAAAVPLAAITALQAMRDAGRVQPGQTVLINGASGGVGTFAVQIAKSLGAEVTGVCSTRNVEMVRAIGADHVVDYTQEDFTKTGERYDIILDNVANHSLADCRSALTPKGTLIPSSAAGGLSRPLMAVVLSPFVSQRLRPLIAKPKQEDLVALRDLIEAGEVTPVIDRTYPLSEVPAALAHFGEGHAQGKTVISV